MVFTHKLREISLMVKNNCTIVVEDRYCRRREGKKEELQIRYRKSDRSSRSSDTSTNSDEGSFIRQFIRNNVSTARVVRSDIVWSSAKDDGSTGFWKTWNWWVSPLRSGQCDQVPQRQGAVKIQRTHAKRPKQTRNNVFTKSHIHLDMRRLSYEKCVCFVLLVIVAFLSCAGFRIDRSEMTDLFSRRNSHTSNSLEYRSKNSLFLDKLIAISINSDINTATTNIRQQHNYEVERQKRSLSTFDENRYGRSRHRIRHSRKLQRLGQAALIESDRNSSVPKAWIDVHVIETKNASETDRNLHHQHHRPPPITLPLVMTTSSATTSDLIAQIPPSDLVLPRPTHEIINRLQRSPFKRKHRQKRKKKRANNHCQKQDLARNAYVADTVMLARAESMSLNRTVNANYSVTFRIIEVFKSKEPRNSDTIRLTFIYSRKAQNCEPRHESRLVKANIKKMKEYFLFLKSDGSYSYSVYRTPMLRKKENRKKGGGKRDGDRRRNGNNSNDAQIAIVRKVCNATFGKYKFLHNY